MLSLDASHKSLDYCVCFMVNREWPRCAVGTTGEFSVADSEALTRCEEAS